MALTINSVTFDATDPGKLAAFWAAVFEVETPKPINPYVSILQLDGGPRLMFIAVPEPKTAKNRCHLDLHAVNEAAVEAQVERLVGLGATVVGKHREFGTHWTTIRDSEGNELCIGTPMTD